MTSPHFPPAAPGQQTAVAAPQHATPQQQAPHGQQPWQQPWQHTSPLVPDQGATPRKGAGWATLAGAAVIALGSFLPWASVQLVGPIYGTDGDGVITLGVAVLVAVLGLLAGLGKGRAWMFAAAIFLGLIAAGIGAYDLSNISSFVSGESMASLGAGLPIIIAGALIVLGGSFFGLVRGRRRP